MNSDEFQGGARYVGGRVEKAVGDAVDNRDWKVDGVVDEVAGGAQHLQGRARAIVEDAVSTAPELAEQARNRLTAAGHQAADAAQRGGRAAAESVRNTPAAWLAAAAVAGYALSWLIHGRRD